MQIAAGKGRRRKNMPQTISFERASIAVGAINNLKLGKKVETRRNEKLIEKKQKTPILSKVADEQYLLQKKVKQELQAKLR